MVDERGPWRVAWSEEDGEYVATTPAYASLSWLAPTPTAALAGLIELTRQADADAAANPEAPDVGGLVRVRFERSYLIRRSQVWDDVLVPAAMMAAVDDGTAGPEVDQYVRDHGAPTSETDEQVDDDGRTWALVRQAPDR